MELDALSARYARVGELRDWIKHHPGGKERVLLREPERCVQCGEVFLSLYPLRGCIDHAGLERA